MTYKLTDIKTFYRFLQDLVFNFKEVRQTSSCISKAFKEKIILAVTQVNGCRLCSYVHSKKALETGIGKEEIQMLLSGDFDTLTQQEAEAIYFAQHYAESRGRYDPALYNKLEQHLGTDTAKAVLSTIRVIMVANTHGIALELLQMRLRAKRDKASSLKNELGIILGPVIMLPVTLVKKLCVRDR